MKDIIEEEDVDYKVCTNKEYANYLNKLIRERLEMGYTKLDKDNNLPEHVYKDKYDHSTHRIHYYLEGLEPEKVECEHEYKRTKMTRNPQDDGLVIIAHCEVDNEFCPLCGERLNNE